MTNAELDALVGRVNNAEWDRVTRVGPNKTGFCEPDDQSPKLIAAALTQLRAELLTVLQREAETIKRYEELFERYDKLLTRWSESRERHLAAEARTDAAESRLQTLKAAFRINMLRAFPDKTHAEISAEIDATLTAPDAGRDKDGLEEERFMEKQHAPSMLKQPTPAQPGDSAGEMK